MKVERNEDYLSWDAYNESADLSMQIELYRKRFNVLPKELQADKICLEAKNREILKASLPKRDNDPKGASLSHF